MFSLKYCIVHHKTHQAPLLCLPVKFYSCFKLSIILFENDIYDVRPKKIFGVGGGWMVDVGWYGKRQGRGLLLTTLDSIACILCRKKSHTGNTIYVLGELL